MAISSIAHNKDKLCRTALGFALFGFGADRFIEVISGLGMVQQASSGMALAVPVKAYTRRS